VATGEEWPWDHLACRTLFQLPKAEDVFPLQRSEGNLGEMGPGFRVALGAGWTSRVRTAHVCAGVDARGCFLFLLPAS
jgi:hypothetical protein